MANDSMYSIVGSRDTALHPSPYKTFTQTFSPHQLKDLFRWCEFLFYNSPHIIAALRKFGEYPVTSITYDTSNEHVRSQHKNLLEKTVKARALLIEATLDKYVYGNGFITMYQPFLRFLECPKCKSTTNIKNVSYALKLDHLKFAYECPNCKSKVSVGRKGVKDIKLVLASGIHFIRWNPKQIDIEHNEITGESIYYYTIPSDMVQRVRQGHKSVIDTLPWGFLESIKQRKKFKFAKDAVFHLKIGCPAGVNPQWGLPPLLSVLSLFHYTAILRKANEAIALDHLLPLRVLHPAQSSGAGDPITQMNLSKWQDSMKGNVKKWREDPLRIMYAPVPVGMTQIGGQGRALLTLGEIQEAEKSIVAALGIPLEFIYGGLTGSGMEATLRLIENQLETHINDLLDLLQWVDDKCANFLGWEKIKVGMTKFRMTDDQNTKQMMYQMWASGRAGQGAKVLSDQTIADLYNIDLHAEKKKIEQEALDEVRNQEEMATKVEQLKNNLAQRVKADAQGGSSPMGYNQQQIIAYADQLVSQLQSADAGQQRSVLYRLQTEDFVLYSVVIQRLKAMRNASKGAEGQGA